MKNPTRSMFNKIHQSKSELDPVLDSNSKLLILRFKLKIRKIKGIRFIVICTFKGVILATGFPTNVSTFL